MPRVYNRHHGDAPKDAIYVGRPTKWGNPYSHLRANGTIRVNTRELAVKRYRAYLESRADLKEAARRELAGKDLVCWCAPAECHAYVLMEIANAVDSEGQS